MSVTERDAELVYAFTHREVPPDPPEWWRGAIFYEVYTHSFNDTMGNGLGDIRGVTEKLPYIRDLGVDGLWLTPAITGVVLQTGRISSAISLTISLAFP